jgi:hypothetical protein
MTTMMFEPLPSKEETDALLLKIRATLSPEQQAEFDSDMAAIHERMNEYTLKHMMKWGITMPTKTKAILVEENSTLRHQLTVAKEQLIGAAILGGVVTAFLMTALQYI